MCSLGKQSSPVLKLDETGKVVQVSYEKLEDVRFEVNVKVKRLQKFQ